jgi:cation diffusion facilitator CzcD-associated flavoprotein CzcO
MFHSARWDYSVDLKDKNVLVVGTGCSAAQAVPQLTKAPFNAKSVTQLMKSPPWVAGRHIPPGGNKGWAKFSPFAFTMIPGLIHLVRYIIFFAAETEWVYFLGTAHAEKARKKYEKALLQHMRDTVPSKYHEILTPDYSVGCKRRIFDATWLPSLNDPRINLTTLPLTSLQEHSVTLGPGRNYPNPKNTNSKVSTEQTTVPTDVIVLANGFEAHHWLHPLKITGKGGKDLIETMIERGGPQAYQGTAMDGFPNFQMLVGPNTITGHSSVILATENMTDYTLRFVKLVLEGDARTFDVKKEAEISYTKDIQGAMKDTVWMKGGCSSWYFKDGWNSTVLP